MVRRESLGREARPAGAVQKVYVFRLDRLARSGIRDTFDVVEELRGHGVKIVTLADGFDLDGPAADVVITVMAWASKMERLAINERISAARDRLAAEGKPWGRPSQFSPSDVRHIQALRNQGRTIRDTAGSLKVPRSSVAYALGRVNPR